MRLLRTPDGRTFTLIDDLEDNEVPPYAILSHTWGPNGQEVTFQDLQNGIGREKEGYRKLEFCAKQAWHDGYTHFWVDTCCIDKTNSVELNSAITSMFRWYQNAAKCYVYLADVAASVEAPSSVDRDWTPEFRDARWLRRGWTLQEVIAPQTVDFFDKHGTKLGDKRTLERHICEISGTPADALRGRPLPSFSIEERLSWQGPRQTKKPEDRAYSLFGICGVSMVPIYGEGKDQAMARLRRAIEADSKGVYICEHVQ